MSISNYEYIELALVLAFTLSMFYGFSRFKQLKQLKEISIAWKSIIFGVIIGVVYFGVLKTLEVIYEKNVNVLEKSIIMSLLIIQSSIFMYKDEKPNMGTLTVMAYLYVKLVSHGREHN